MDSNRNDSAKCQSIRMLHAIINNLAVAGEFCTYGSPFVRKNCWKLAVRWKLSQARLPSWAHAGRWGQKPTYTFIPILPSFTINKLQLISSNILGIRLLTLLGLTLLGIGQLTLYAVEISSPLCASHYTIAQHAQHLWSSSARGNCRGGDPLKSSQFNSVIAASSWMSKQKIIPHVLPLLVPTGSYRSC